MGYRLVDVELSRPAAKVQLAPEQSGIGLLCRWHGRLVGFTMERTAPGTLLDGAALEDIAQLRFAMRLLQLKAEQALEPSSARPPAREPVSLSIAVCTKDRAQRLRRLLLSLRDVVSRSRFRAVEVLVIDNASVDSSTRDVVAEFAGYRYVMEARTGLDFARNAAVHAASGELLAFLDDDVVVDTHWLDGLHAVWEDCPEAGGYSGLVLPFRLDTRAQIAFEYFGGFGRGFKRIHHHGVKLGNPLYPVSSGLVGAGCNMAFDRKLLLELGGFDEALDTGAPLPGGGDLDIFYRVLRSGRGMVYEPRYAVFHEHRETLQQLRRQYWTWGLGFMTFLVKSRRTDAAMNARHKATVRWWFKHQLKTLFSSLRHRRLQYALFALAELRGAVQGLAGEYDRSQRRSRLIREQVETAVRNAS
jgi:glycosyltransferase involved in cell wall biosynthesis